VPYRTRGVIDLEALARDLPAPTTATRARHVGIAVAALLGVLCVALVLADRIPAAPPSRAAAATRRFEPPRQRKWPAAGAALPVETEGFNEQDPFSGAGPIRQYVYTTEAGTVEFIAPIDGLRIDDVSRSHDPISKRHVRRIAASRAGRLYDCYRPLLAALPTAKGTVRVSFRIQPNGTTSAPDLETTIDDPALMRCLTRTFTGILFSQIGTTQNVTYALRLDAGTR
jgi:hypothetical protein